MMHLSRHSEMLDLRVVEYLVNSIDWTAGDARAVEDLDPFVSATYPQFVSDGLVQGNAVLRAQLLIAVARVVQEISGFYGSAEAREDLLAVGRDVDRIVCRGEQTGWDAGRVIVAGLSGTSPATSQRAA
jgi:hypothetical protein